MREIDAPVRNRARIAADIYAVTLAIPRQTAELAVPGQFAHIKVPENGALPLRRPISIFSVEAMPGSADESLLHLAIQPKGEGTQRLTGVKANDTVNILFPLGKGFDAGEAENIWLVGGGVGAAPLRFAAEYFKGRAKRAFFGYRTFEHVYGVHECDAAGCRVTVCTDDGSAGTHGLVTDALLGALKQEKPSLLMACGPTPMLKAVKQIAREQGIPAQLSMEQRMGCGFGACLTCSCAASGGGYHRVCADGPVFDAGEVSL